MSVDPHGEEIETIRKERNMTLMVTTERLEITVPTLCYDNICNKH